MLSQCAVLEDSIGVGEPASRLLFPNLPRPHKVTRAISGRLHLVDLMIRLRPCAAGEHLKPKEASYHGKNSVGLVGRDIVVGIQLDDRGGAVALGPARSGSQGDE